MMFFSNLTVAKKVIALTVTMVALTAIVAAVGVQGIRTLKDDIGEVDLAGGEALTGARAARDAVMLNRAEFRLAADPSPQTLRAIEEQAAALKRQLEDRLAELRRSANPEQARMLATIEQRWVAYTREFDDTLATVRRVGGAVRATRPRVPSTSPPSQAVRRPRR